MQRTISRDTPSIGRRTLIGAGLAVSTLTGSAARAQDVADAPPQRGDHFVHLGGPHKGEVVKIENLVVGGAQIQAYPADRNGVVRNGSRLNIVLMARLNSDDLSEETRARAAEGVVAYSGVCTHQACPVNMWSEEQAAFVCSCHGSTYDPRNGAQVISGPAPHPLAALPLMSEGGVVYVAGAFTRKVGASQV